MDFMPSSDLWWRYFIYGGLFHLVAATPLCKTDKQAELFRFVGYAIATIPVVFREGVLAGVWMIVFLYGLTFTIRVVKDFLKF